MLGRFTRILGKKEGAPFETPARDFVSALKANGFALWPVQRPGAWETAADPGRNPGVQWVEHYGRRVLAALNLCDMELFGTIDASGLSFLERLHLSRNALEGLKTNAALTHLAADGNALKEIDLAASRDLRELILHENRLSSLDLSRNPDLTRLDAAGNKLGRIDLAHNSELVHLNVSDAGLTELDLAANKKLLFIAASNNRLQELYLARQNSLARLALAYNRLAALDLAHNPLLAALDVKGNRLAALDLSANAKLCDVYAADNQLKNLDLSANGRLSILDAGQNHLEDLDLTQNPELRRLYLSSNRLRRLDLSRNPRLERLYVNDNPLTEISWPEALPRLKELSLADCRLPLSRLAPCAGLAESLNILGPQNRVLFEQLHLKTGAALDLSREAEFGGQPTRFTILNEQRRAAAPDCADVAEGRVVFNKPGRYIIMMQNPQIASSGPSPSHNEEARAHTGFIDVLN